MLNQTHLFVPKTVYSYGEKKKFKRCKQLFICIAFGQTEARAK